MIRAAAIIGALALCAGAVFLATRPPPPPPSPCGFGDQGDRPFWRKEIERIEVDIALTEANIRSSERKVRVLEFRWPIEREDTADFANVWGYDPLLPLLDARFKEDIQAERDDQAWNARRLDRLRGCREIAFFRFQNAP